RTVVIPEIKIEAVKPMVDPPLQAFTPGEARDYPAQSRIDIEPGGIRISEFDAEHRQRRLAVGRMIVRIVRRKQRRLDYRNVGIPLLDPVQHRFNREGLAADL